MPSFFVGVFSISLKSNTYQHLETIVELAVAACRFPNNLPDLGKTANVQKENDQLQNQWVEYLCEFLWMNI